MKREKQNWRPEESKNYFVQHCINSKLRPTALLVVYTSPLAIIEMKILITILLILFTLAGLKPALGESCKSVSNNTFTYLESDTTLNNLRLKNYLRTRNFELVKQQYPARIKDASLKWDMFTSIDTCTMLFDATKFSTPYDSIALIRLYLIAQTLIEEKSPVILTTGSNGNGGRGLANLDLITRKYGFIYLTVGSLSCSPSRINVALERFNEVTMAYLNKVNPQGWANDMEKEIKAHQQISRRK
ncbi:hypothetical protein [Sabulibacter ruber]|uniref:hypothetical protein n=1 Tax=Sabulibacter ruber TaxID=2811901 RepID=UPI001A95B63F|nr:hypothetical protein [Sabulibacter ruber]